MSSLGLLTGFFFSPTGYELHFPASLQHFYYWSLWMLYYYKATFAYHHLKDIEPCSGEQLIFQWLGSFFVGIFRILGGRFNEVFT